MNPVTVPFRATILKTSVIDHESLADEMTPDELLAMDREFLAIMRKGYSASDGQGN